MKNILLALLSLLAIQIFAQIDGVDVKISKPMQYESLDQKPWHTFPTPDGKLLVITDLNEGFSSTVVDLNGKELAPKKEYKTVFKDQNFDYGSTYEKRYIQIEDKLYAFGRENSKSEAAILALPIDKTGKPQSESKKILFFPPRETTTTLGTPHSPPSDVELNGIRDITWYTMNYSSDRKKIVVFHRYRDLEKGDDGRHAKIAIAIFDKNLNKVASSEFLSPHLEKDTKFFSFTSDSKNNTYILSEINENKTKKYELDLIAPNSTEVKKIILEDNIQDHLIKICVAENNKGEIYIYGYSNSWSFVTGKSAKNLKLYKIDIKNGTSKQIIDVPLNFKETFGKDAPKRGYYDVLYAQDVICREDGSMILVGAGRVDYGLNISNELGFTASYIDAFGKLIWTKNIFNFYLTIDKYRPVLVGNDGIYIISPIADDIQNVKDQILSHITLSKISFDGKQTDKIILKSVDKITTLMLSEDGKTLIADVAYGYTKNKEQPKGSPYEIDTITDQIITVTLK